MARNALAHARGRPSAYSCSGLGGTRPSVELSWRRLTAEKIGWLPRHCTIRARCCAGVIFIQPTVTWVALPSPVRAVVSSRPFVLLALPARALAKATRSLRDRFQQFQVAVTHGHTADRDSASARHGTGRARSRSAVPWARQSASVRARTTRRTRPRLRRPCGSSRSSLRCSASSTTTRTLTAHARTFRRKAFD